MSTRKIKPTHVSYTGRFWSHKLQRSVCYESSLERDMIYLLEFSRQVSTYQEQPLRIEYVHANKKHIYTPDLLVTYQQQNTRDPDQIPTLIEVKLRKNLWKTWKEHKPKYQAALRHASQQGWRFKIMTEVEIRTPYLDNVRFLLGYIELSVKQEHISLLMDTIKHLQVFTAASLLAALSHEGISDSELITGVWHMVAHGIIQADLNQKIDMQSQLRYNPSIL